MQQQVPSSWGILRCKLETSTVTRMVSGGMRLFQGLK